MRFGNVVGSSGSLLDAIKHQLKISNEVKITDKKMTRYFGFFLIIIGYVRSKLLSVNYLEIYEKYFLIGASIYVGTFIIGANVDYRLIFLIFTIPYILDVKNIFLKYCLVFSYIISINSFLFQSGNVLSINFFMKAILVFGCKFFIFTSLLIMIGNILKKISLFEFKFLKNV